MWRLKDLKRPHLKIWISFPLQSPLFSQGNVKKRLRSNEVLMNVISSIGLDKRLAQAKRNSGIAPLAPGGSRCSHRLHPGEFTDLAFFLLRCSILTKSRTQLDDDELIVVGLSRTDVTPDAEGEVVIV